MKTIRQCPAGLHQTPKKSAKANRRSVNAETLIRLEKQPERSGTMTGAEWAKNLRQAQAMLTPEDREQIGQGIQEARDKMSRDHLH